MGIEQILAEDARQLRKVQPVPNKLRDEPGAARGQVDLDGIDRQLLAQLQAEGRLANNSLAARVGIAPSTCLARVRRLQSPGVIRGYHADVDLAACGLPLQALVAVRLQAGARSRIAQFQEQWRRSPGCSTCSSCPGRTTSQVHVAVQDPDTLRRFVVEHLSVASEVAMTKTSLIFEHVGTSHLG